MIKLARKDLKLFFSDKRAVLLAFLLPIALITLFAIAFGAVFKRGESRPASLVVADDDKSAASKNVITQLDSLKEFNVSQKSTQDAENLVKKGDEAAVLIFHKGFGDSLNAGNKPPIELKYDAAREAEVGILQAALIGNLMNIIGGKSMAKKTLTKFDTDNPDLNPAIREKIHAQIQQNFSSDESKKQSESFLKVTPLVAEKENSPGLIQAVAGVAVMMLLFSVTAMGAGILDEKQEGTLKKLISAPIHPRNILLGKMVATNIISLFQLLVMFLFAWLAFGLDIMPYIPSLMLMIIVTAYACSSFGVLLASFVKSRQQVQGLSTLIILVMSCIGGSMIPIFIMPLFMQKIAVFSVNYWAIQGFFDIFWRMFPITDLTFLSRVLVLILIGTTMNLLAIRLFRKNILKIA